MTELLQSSVPEREKANEVVDEFGRSLGGICWLIAIASVWTWTWLHLSLAWGAYPNYQFGFAVPFLFIYLVSNRVRAVRLVDQRGRSGWSVSVVFCFSLVFCWLVFQFAELMRQIDPLWRPIGFLMMAVATVLSFAVAYQAGGRRFVLALVSPVVFAWSAVPWPTFLEGYVMRGLKHFVTVVNVEVLNSLCVPAVQKGNVIELSMGSVVVDGACSGVNSIQSSIMIALFLGELFAFRWGRRLWLLIASVVIAIAGNVCRTFALSKLVAEFGEEALHTYHDHLGMIAMVAIYAGIIGLGISMSGAVGLPSLMGTEWRWRMFLPNSGLRAWSGVGAAVAFVSVPFVARAWFAVSPGGQIRAQESALWRLKERVGLDGWDVRTVSFTKTEEEALRFTEAQARRVSTPAGTEASVYHFFWEPNDTHVGMFFDHTPDVCMPGAGWVLTSAPTVIQARFKELYVPSRVFHFMRDGVESVAIQSIWRGGEAGIVGKLESGDERNARIGLLWKGPRLRGMEVLTVFLSGNLSGHPEEKASRILDEILVKN